MVFVDEIDKICGPESAHGPDVSRQGVQRDLLPIVEGCAVTSRHGTGPDGPYPLHRGRGLFPLQTLRPHAGTPGPVPHPGRTQGTLHARISCGSSRNPKTPSPNSKRPCSPPKASTIDFTPDAVEAMARIAYQVNQSAQNIGARRLYTIVEKLLEDVSFDAPKFKGQKITIDEKYVQDHLGELAKDEDLSKFIL